MELRGKKVLVTGAGGFIGSHLVERLLEENCEVKAFVRYNSLNRWGWLDAFPKSVLKEIEIISGDIRNTDIVRQAVKGTEVVFHLSALISIPYSYISPESYCSNSISLSGHDCSKLSELLPRRPRSELELLDGSCESYRGSQVQRLSEKKVTI